MENKSQYTVIVSDRARQMLTGHIRFWVQKSPPAAREVKNSLMDAIRSLYQMPERYPFLNAEFIPPNKYHKMFVEKWYLLLYQIKDRMVYVDYIIDCRQDYGWLIQQTF
ncbi:type II toxin-antitoxin system RelE/ParE family toxin [Desulfosporosinus sp. PR]|uniref:type II toxin-antitoxin system RelE/ParE family toxin n=1 Tax=Candidatus Desulfosporosinus nitrosoreducens TaxID=3401928 RepID=UPI0027F0A393|nr:type II toxin-antitoxin system RelE/ParE family toxin [Desulfosporosinus sp. PR]MDQ7094654.1 type II toxin-antitoxin system RelE/ParE family toxin [Desulfosporosinus sp. PR]